MSHENGLQDIISIMEISSEKALNNHLEDGWVFIGIRRLPEKDVYVVGEKKGREITHEHTI